MSIPSDVFVIESEGRFYVRPATAVVRGDAFRIRNFTGLEVKIEMDDRLTAVIYQNLKKLGNAEKRRQPGTLPNGLSRAYAVPPDAVGPYPYTVLVGSAETRAEGNSRPVIIVDR